MVFGPGELYDIKANQSDSLLHNIKCVLPPRGRPLCTTVSGTFGVKAPNVVLQEKPFQCFYVFLLMSKYRPVLIKRPV